MTLGRRFTVFARRHLGCIPVPCISMSAVDLEPFHLIELRIGKFAQSERAGRSPEFEIAGRLSLVFWTMGIMGSDGRILQIAGGISIAGLPDILQQFVIAGTVVEAVGLAVTFGRAAGISRPTTIRIVDQSPPIEALIA